MPTLHIEFNPTGGTNFTVKYKRSGTLDPWTEQGGFTGSPIDITVPYSTPYDFCIKKLCGIDHNGGQTESWEVCNTAAPASECLTPVFNYISRSGADFTFSYVLQPNQPLFQLQVIDPNGNVIGYQTFDAATTPSPFVYTVPSIISGTYQFRIRAICGRVKLASPMSNWTAYEDVVVGVSLCTPPSDIVEQLCQIAAITNPSTPMLDAVTGVPYKHVLYLTGTAPFDCNLDVGPAWMSANYVLDLGGNDTIELTGTPTTDGTFDVGVQVKNCGNDYAHGVRFDSSLNVAVGVLVQDFEMNNNYSDPVTYNLFVNTIDVSGERTQGVVSTINIAASGALINNASSEVIVQFNIGMPTFPASSNLVYTGGTVAGVWDAPSRTFTYSGIDTTIAQPLVINFTS